MNETPSRRPDPDAPGSPRVHHVAFVPSSQQRVALLLLTAILSLSCLFTTCAGLLLQSIDWTPWFLLAPVLAGVVVAIRRAMWLADWRRIFAHAQTERQTLGVDLTSALNHAPGTLPCFADALVAYLRQVDAQRFCPGEVVRVGEHPWPIRTFGVPFEPTPLDGADPQMRGLRGVLLPPGHATRGTRGRKAGFLVFWIGFWGLFAWLAPWFVVPWLVLGAAGLQLALHLAGFEFRFPTWFVAPGMVMRRGLLRRGLRVYRAQEHRLLVIEHDAAREVFLLTPKRVIRWTLSHSETEVLLAAWLSPLPPPTDEQLTELGA